MLKCQSTNTVINVRHDTPAMRKARREAEFHRINEIQNKTEEE